jgi:hypothetical protein
MNATPLLSRLRGIAAGLIAVLALDVAAQTPPVSWAVSAYGPDGAPATLGCGSCASDQRSMAVDAAGDVIVTGFTDTSTLSDIMTVKFSGATGAVIWMKTFDSVGSGYDQSWAMALDAAGNAIVTGYTFNGGAEYDIKTIKYAAADGAILWQNTFAGPASGIDFGIAIAVDGAGNAIVAGNVWNGTDDDMKTIKFAAADGSVLWDKTFAGAAGANDYVYAMAVDGAGNVVVTGEATNTVASGPDWKTIKYAAADGAVLWQATFAGAGNGLDIPFGIAIDGASNVFVVGNSQVGAAADAKYDAKIIKYDGLNGGVLWEKTFAGPDDGDDMFYALALDPAGDAIATGFTFDTTGNNDWNTVKYRSSDGAILWAKTFGGSGNLSDVSVAVAVDAAGNAIVGGRVNNSADPDNRDMQAVKYAGADGALLWSYTHAGSANGFDRVVAVAAQAGSVFLAGESLETGFSTGWRIVKLGALSKTRADFNADRRSDVLWRNSSTGENYLYPMNGTTILAGEGYVRAVPDLSWSIAGTGDFDGNGSADILWRNSSTGQNYVYFMNGVSIVGEGYLRTVSDQNWQVAGVGDFNGDGRDDILWRHGTSGANYVYFMNGVSIANEGSLRTVADTAWQVKGVGDFNGDGNADILWRHATSGENYLYLMNGVSIAAEGYLRTVANPAWQIRGVGDFDGDGRADILWRNGTSGENYLYLMNGVSIANEGYVRTVADSNWQVAAVGDYDGDGRTDILWRNGSSGENYLYPMDGTTIKSSEGYLRSVPAGPWTIVGR